MNIKPIIEDLLNKSISLDDLDLTKEQVEEIELTLETLKKNAGFGHPEVGDSLAMSTGEMIKFDKCGQWKIEKSTLDYSKFNKPDSEKRKESEANARTLDYSKMVTPENKIKPWTGAKAKGDAARAKAAESIAAVRAKEAKAVPPKPTPKQYLENEHVEPGAGNKETALDAINRRQKVK